jgi:hypothetical protein
MPLDRVFNGVFKHYYNSELRECIGAGVMPNMRVILTCVSRALDHISPEVTKAGWRGFYPYDRVGMIPVEEQKAAVELHAQLRKPNQDRCLLVISSAVADQVPDFLRLHPREHPYPSFDEAGIRLPENLDFSKEDLNYRPNHPFMQPPPPPPLHFHGPSQESALSMPLIPPRRPPPLLDEEHQPQQQHQQEESESDDEVELDAVVPDLDELRKEIGAPFQRQKQLGGAKKTFSVIGLVTAEKIQSELQRMQQVALDEEERKAALQEEKRQLAQQRKATSVPRGRGRGGGRPRGRGRGVSRGRGRGRGIVILPQVSQSDSAEEMVDSQDKPSQAASSGTMLSSLSSGGGNYEDGEIME